MKEIRLNCLHLRNFKGARDLRIKLDSRNASLFGTNGSFKTTVYDALCWLLDDKDSLGRSPQKFSIKTVAEDGSELHNLSHEVEGRLLVDGRETTLRKVYEEKWTRRRGQADAEMTGHTTQHYVDDVPEQKQRYDELVAELIGVEDLSTVRLLTDPREAVERLHWQDRRALLLEVVGDVSVEDVVAEHGEIDALADELAERSPDDYRKLLRARRSELNDLLEKLPERIDEASLAAPDEPERSERELRVVASGLDESLSEARRELARAEEGGGAATVRDELSEARSALSARVDELRSEHEAERRSLRSKVSDVEQALRDLEADKKRVKGLLDAAEAGVREFGERLETLREDRELLDAEEFSLDDVGDRCPTCEEPLSEEKLEAARREAREQFNAAKARRLREIDEKIAQAETLQAEQSERRDEHRERIEALVAAGREAEAELAAAQDRLDEHPAEPLLDADERTVDLSERVEKLETRLAELEIGSTDEVEKLELRVSELEEKRDVVRSELAAHAEREKAQKRVAELEEREQRAAAEFERTERSLWTLDEFERTRAAMLTDAINERFETVRWKLFRELVNGGVEPTCEATVDGVPYDGGLNTGSRVRAGLELVSVLQEHYGARLPVFVDRCESVTRLPEMRCQVVRLVVSKPDKELRVELAGEAGEEAA